MSHVIHIDDLAEPRLSETQRQALAWGETVKVDFSEEAILDEARRRTGLSDFGVDGFRIRLKVLREEWDADPDITALSRISLYGYLVRYASNRLLIRDTLKRHPEIHDEKIDKPIIVAGLPRSGTTHLVNLLAADGRFYSLPLWESYEPVPLPDEMLLPDGTDPRRQRCAEAWEAMKQTAPMMAAMHPMEPEHIHEELELMGPDFASYNFEWLSLSPRWRDYYYATDQTPHYEYMKTVLKLLQWRRRQAGQPNKRWVLKCPQHMEQLPVVHRIFPDATVVITHRDPVAVIQSIVTMQAYSQRINRRRVTIDYLIEYWADRVEHLLRACVRDRDCLPAERSFDSPFDRFMADEMGTINLVYAKASLELTPSALTQLYNYASGHPRGKEGKIIYDLERDFGVNPAELRRRFAFYFDYFPVTPEANA